MSSNNQPMSPRLQRLVGFVERDPGNMALRADAASAAIDEHQLDLAAELIEQRPSSADLPPALLNLQGIVAIARQRFDEAVPVFERLRASGVDAPAIRFNLAWAKMMTSDFVGANELLDDEAIAASSRGPSLKVQAMHHLDLYQEGLAVGRELAERYPENTALMGALATLAMDAEDGELARYYAERSGDNPEGLAARGMLTLAGPDTGAALDLFDEAIARHQHNPRAWIGRGLGLLKSGDAVAGAEALDRGAALFKDHLGSWIAAGWAHFVNGDYAKARADFDQAMSIDDTFAETHGGLAVLDIVAGDIASAERRCEIALRLDRKSFGGALAKSMLLDRHGHQEAAQRVRRIAMTTPIGPNGETIAQAMIGLGTLSRGK